MSLLTVALTTENKINPQPHSPASRLEGTWAGRKAAFPQQPVRADLGLEEVQFPERTALQPLRWSRLLGTRSQ